LMTQQKVIPEAVFVGNPASRLSKSWMPDRVVRA
jgi:hypothetical protein